MSLDQIQPGIFVSKYHNFDFAGTAVDDQLLFIIFLSQNPTWYC